MDVPCEHITVKTPGTTLHAVAAGPEDGPLVVLLHGFPDFWYGWRHQIAALAEAGYRVVAPDQRGYNLSDKPPRVEDYRFNHLAQDVAAIIDHMGAERADIVGHDWGAGVAWWVAQHFAPRVRRMVAINLPHPVVLRNAFLTRPAQLRASWYMFAFQCPVLPETMLLSNRCGRLLGQLRKLIRPGAITREELARYRDAWEQPGAMTGMVHWYRAAIRRPVAEAKPWVERPTMIVWGDSDPHLLTALAHDSMKLCAQPRLELVEGAGHYPHIDDPERVNAALLDFLGHPKEESAP